jgi:Holliday junction DNA helicase RuvA
MISFLFGSIVEKSPTEIVLDVHGVGYAVSISLSTYEKLEHATGEVKVLTYLHVREDAMQLYGFATESERQLFRQLISVSGIGPKMAQGILSGMNPSEFRDAIMQGNLMALTSIQGIGRKTAERLILELREKVGKIEDLQLDIPAAGSQQMKIRAEAVIALMSLGYSRLNAEKALRAVLNETGTRELPLEDLIKKALRHASQV